MKKRFLSILLCCVMVLMLFPVTAFADESPGILGDLDLDGDVTVKDAVHLQNYLEGLESFENLTHKQLAVADFNGDGVVNYNDWTGLQSYLENDLGLPVSNITVTNGKATACGTEIGKAAEGTRVTLTADSPSDNMVFDKWIVNEGGVTLADASSATTTFTMPAYQVSVTATYKQKYTLAITVDGFEVGKTPADCTVTFDSTIPGVTFSEDDIQFFYWEKCIFGEETSNLWHLVYEIEAFEAGASYRISMNLDNKGLTEVPTITVNGKTPYYCKIATRDGMPIQLQIACTLGTPEPILTLTVPFTTTVKLGGNVAPGETTFRLGLIDGTGNELAYDDQCFFAEITTDGAGSYSGVMTITATGEWLDDMLSEGAFIWQYDGEEDGWTYDDTVWGVRLSMPEIAARSVDGVQYSLLVYPTYIMDNGCFNLDLNAGPVARMSFTNTYTYSYSAPVRDTATIIIGGEKEESKPVEENPNTGAPVAANMSTLSVLVLAAAAVAVLKTRKR